MKLEVAQIPASVTPNPIKPPTVLAGSGVAIPIADIFLALLNHFNTFCELCSLVANSPAPISPVAPNPVPSKYLPVLISSSAIVTASITSAGNSSCILTGGVIEFKPGSDS